MASDEKVRFLMTTLILAILMSFSIPRIAKNESLEPSSLSKGILDSTSIRN